MGQWKEVNGYYLYKILHKSSFQMKFFKPAKAGFINFILNDNEYTTTYYIMYLLLHGLTLLLSISLLKYNKIMDFFTETDLKS